LCEGDRGVGEVEGGERKWFEVEHLSRFVVRIPTGTGREKREDEMVASI
jgi:hypothetical protein